MTKLAYSLIFTPSTVSKDISHLCSDDKIHIRLDNFDKCCRIEGFERKLTYLLTYMFNYNFFNPVLHKDVSAEKLLKLFLSEEEVKPIIETIKTFKYPNLKGIVVFKNYKKLSNKVFGYVDKNCCPLEKADGVIKQGSLKTFLYELNNISLESFLFDNRYSLAIHELKDFTADNKFRLKEERKLKKLNDTNFVELW